MRFKILIIRWSGMGDIIMTLPALKWLRNHIKDCYITYLTDIAFAEIVEKSGLADSVLTIDRRGFAFAGRFLSAAGGTIATIFQLRRKKFDLVYDLQGFGETAILSFLSGAPQRVGRIKNGPLRKRIYNSPIQADWENEHRSRYFIRAVAEARGAKAPAAIEPPELMLNRNRIDSVQKYIGLNIGASTESRRWPEKNFFKLADSLSGKGLEVCFILGPQEAFLVKKTRAVCVKNNWDFAFHSRIETLLEALTRCRLLISNDTGPGHLAAAVGVPVITLFSTGSPENVKPLAKLARWFRNETDINRIKVSAVEEACLSILNTPRL